MLKGSNQNNLKQHISNFSLLLSEATLCHVVDRSSCKTVNESFDSQDAFLPVRAKCSDIYVHFQQ